MTTDGAEQDRRVAAVAGELIHDGEGGPDPAKARISATRARLRAMWLCALLVLVTTAASIALSLAVLLGLSALATPRTLASALLVLWPLWLVSVVATHKLTPKMTNQDPGRLSMRWRLQRWAVLALELLGPFLGQLNALVNGVRLLREKDPETRRAWRPSGIVDLCVAIGWPAMLVIAIFALGPLFLSEVRLGGHTTTWLSLSLEEHLEPVSSLFLVYGSAGVLWLTLTATALVLCGHQARRARQARDAARGSQVLEPGETVVSGTVELAAGADHAVRVEVDQEGSEAESSGSYTQWWTEVERRVLVAPFYLQHPSGERIRVEPSDAVHLMDELDGIILLDRTKRRRFAELVSGEQVVATGRLARGPDPEAGSATYRGGGEGWVLGPPPGAPMLLSTQPLDRPFRRRARVYALLALALAAVAAVGHALLLPYHHRVWASREITGEVTVRRVGTSTNDSGDQVHHYHVSVGSQAPPLALTQEVSREAYDALVEGSLVPVLYVPSHPAWSQMGHRPRASGVLAIALALLITHTYLVLFRMGETSKSWYDKPRVVDHCPGRLPEAT